MKFLPTIVLILIIGPGADAQVGAFSGPTRRISGNMLPLGFVHGGQSVSGVSGDGSVVVFNSVDQLVPEDNNFVNDVYRYDRSTGALALVSKNAGGIAGVFESSDGSVSSDGRFIAFVTFAEDIVPGSSLSGAIAMWDRSSDLVAPVTVTSGGSLPNQVAVYPKLDDYGANLFFSSRASNIVAGDTNNGIDIFKKDMISGLIERVTVTGNGAQLQNGLVMASDWDVSIDGRYVWFRTEMIGAILPPVYPCCGFEYFRRDTLFGLTEQISGTTPAQQSNPYGIIANANGTTFLYSSSVPIPGLYRREMASSQSELVMDYSNSAGVTFGPIATNLDTSQILFNDDSSAWVPSDTNASCDIFWMDLQSTQVRRISVGSGGEEGSLGSCASGGFNIGFGAAAVSADFRWCAFTSDSPEFAVPDSGDSSDCFLTDLGPAENLGFGLAGSFGIPVALVTLPASAGGPGYVTLRHAVSSMPGLLAISTDAAIQPVLGGTMIPTPMFLVPFTTSNDGTYALPFVPLPQGWPAGIELYCQFGVLDSATPQSVSFSNALRLGGI